MADPDLRIVKSEPLPELTLADAPVEGGPETYWGGFRKGLKEGVVGGAKGFVKGMRDAPGALVSGVGHMLTQPVTKTVDETVDAVGRIPAAVRASATDPEGWGRDVGTLTGTTMLTAAVPKMPALARGAARGVLQAGATAADLVSPDVVGVLSPRAGHVLRVVQRMREAAAKKSTTSVGAGPPRLVPTKAPTLTDSLSTVLDELHKEATAPVSEGAPSVPGAAPGGEQAATTSMRLLKEKPYLETRFKRTMSQDAAAPIYHATDFTKPTKVKVPLSKIVATQEGFQDPIIEQYRVHPGSDLPSASQVGDEYILNDGHHRVLAAAANGETEIELNAHPVDRALAAHPQPRAMWLTERGQQVTAPQARTMERFGRTTPYRSEGVPGRPTLRAAPIPLSEAMTVVRQARKTAGLNLTASEFKAATDLVKEGRAGDDVMLAIQAQRELSTAPAALKESTAFRRLPTDAEMRSEIANRVGNRSPSTAAREMSGNPFR